MFISEVTLGLWLERELIYHLSLNKPRGEKKKPEEKKKKELNFWMLFANSTTRILVS